MEVELQLWQLIIGALVTVLIGGASGGGLFWYLVESRRIETTAKETAAKQALASWQALANEQQQRIDAQGDDIDRLRERIQIQEDLITSLQKELSKTRAELAATRRDLSAAQAQIDRLQDENKRLKNKLDYERKRRRELEDRVKENDSD